MSSPKPQVELVVPVLNEAHVLEKSIGKIRGFLREHHFPYPCRIVIANNGSTDGTGELADELARRFDDVAVVHLTERGRGRALRQVWSASQADICAYTDVDISTDLESFEPLCRAIHEDGYDIAIGSRLMKASILKRGFKRDVISRAYNIIIKLMVFTRFTDAQCGFKAVTRHLADTLVPKVEDNGWFFDTELLVLAEKQGYRIKDLPVRWTDDTDSRVRIVSTAWEDLKGLVRVRRHLWSREFRAQAKARKRACSPGESSS